MTGRADAPDPAAGSTIEIDGRSVAFLPGQSVLQAATAAGIAIPALCASEARETWTSCMVCQVKELGTGRMLPSCSVPAEPGMRLESESPEVSRVRRAALELLLAEHRADCRAPCSRACPAGLDVPELMRCFRRGDRDGALRLLELSIALPAATGELCSAPCERSCYRRSLDQSIAIRAFERSCAADPARFAGVAPAPTGGDTCGSVCVIGAGPAGLSAAFHCARLGHRVRLLERAERAGGSLRSAVPTARLSKAALDRDVAAVAARGVEIVLSRAVDPGELPGLARAYDAVILATGEGGMAAERLPGVFACGSLVRSTRLVARGLGDGLEAALRAHARIRGTAPDAWGDGFDSRAGRPSFPDEPAPLPAHVGPSGLPAAADLRAEAGRCLQCDCSAASGCTLRQAAASLGADQGRHRGAGRVAVRRLLGTHVVYEPHKCVRCGRCVAITAARGERWGMAFRGRGLETEVMPPFGRSIDEALALSGAECVRACPTGALSFRAAQRGRHLGAEGSSR